ncbi:MAG: hypothetical protein IJC27_04950 [Lentisphaeria bacterium]|nr:hypothetical protein [Lentisphaeria bacterium]
MNSIYKYFLKKILPSLVVMFPLLCGTQLFAHVRKFAETETLTAVKSPDTPEKKFLPEIFNSAVTACRNESECTPEKNGEYVATDLNAIWVNKSTYISINAEKFNIFLLEIGIVTISGRDGPAG